ncbi:RNA polymerase, sigma-24 subunit, ECF subfamily [Emticicia oligotrophica DSM 17448]|uniref:RNA polymerase, sigma-24 subunit, ECF subfamily n=1 Tax=Emticicia oligotrophica (strain DSM 17448 / CIP 109782 / MTCC 6937 / GPTSA100-15) TaxID=929562 RepID=A0ABN4AR33_EMTOG|nr:sigma-70 family RNA polymerase sigma factor [Emticicia oligotrophica]AFK04689.1 RNA polymerase, sigma-24 subunit, ECF subfamily [Emticicia oligotrophica DSM 17448]
MFFKKSTFSEDNLESVIKACINNNSQAQRTLIKLHLGFAKSICSRYSSNDQEVEEMVNDGFLKIFNNLSKYDASQPFKAWVRTIMINTAIDYYRANKKYQLHVAIDEVEITDFDDDVISKLSTEEIMSLVRKLTPMYRMVFMLYVIEGYKHKEIAEQLGIQEGTSKSNLQDARIKLQEMIRIHYPHLFDIYSSRKNKLNEH